MGTLNYTGNLTVTTCWCGTRHAVPAELHDFQLRQHADGDNVTSIYCPLGHSHIPAGKGAAQIEKEKRAAAEAQLSALRDQLAASEREAERQKARSNAGVCPCCNRSFVQLARHMKTKHPEAVT